MMMGVVLGILTMLTSIFSGTALTQYVLRLIQQEPQELTPYLRTQVHYKSVPMQLLISPVPQ